MQDSIQKTPKYLEHWKPDTISLSIFSDTLLPVNDSIYIQFSGILDMSNPQDTVKITLISNKNKDSLNNLEFMLKIDDMADSLRDLPMKTLLKIKSSESSQVPDLQVGSIETKDSLTWNLYTQKFGKQLPYYISEFTYLIHEPPGGATAHWDENQECYIGEYGEHWPREVREEYKIYHKNTDSLVYDTVSILNSGIFKLILSNAQP